MRRQLNTLYVTTEGAWLHLDGANLVMEVERQERARIPVHMLQGLVCFGRVLVSPPKMDPKEEEELTKKNSQAVMTALIKRDRRELEKVEYPQDAIVPRKYWAETTSGLTCSVKEGENTADFELTRPEKKK